LSTSSWPADGEEHHPEQPEGDALLAGIDLQGRLPAHRTLWPSGGALSC
jgi:hypothetical protein